MKINRIITLFCLFLSLILVHQSLFSKACAGEAVTLASLEWEPYIGENLKNGGYVYELVEKAFIRAGYEPDIQYYPWARSLSLVENGKRDGLFPEYYDKSREENFIFSDPFPGGPVGFYKRKKDPIAYAVDPVKDIEGALKAFKKYRFGVVRGYLNTPAFDAADYLVKDEANSDETNLKKLFAGRIDLIFIDQYVAKHIIVQKFPHYLDHLEFMEPPLEVKPLYIAFSRKATDYKKKCAAFNRGLKMIKEDGTLKEIMLDHGF